MRLIGLLTFFLAMATNAADPAKNLLKTTNDVKSWNFEEHESGKGAISAEGDSIVFDVKEVTGTDWHVQAYQLDLDLKEGKQYVLAFEIKGTNNQNVSCAASIGEEDWHDIGLREEMYLSKEFKKQEYTFYATGVVSKKNRIGFVLGNNRGTVTVKEMVLTEK